MKTKFRVRFRGRVLPIALTVSLTFAPMMTGSSRGAATSAAGSGSAPPVAVNQTPGPPPGEATAQELQELVSPIALYPDVLVAQILAGSTYPTQVVEADRWLKDNSNLTGDQLANQVNQQAWDPSIKSLTQFPTVL